MGSSPPHAVLGASTAVTLRPGSALGCLISDLPVPWAAFCGPHPHKQDELLSLPLHSQMPFVLSAARKGPLDFLPSAPRLCLLSTLALPCTLT